jgi:hypothetical protein
MIAQIQCSQGYQKFVEKCWLRKIYSKSCHVWTMVSCRLELQTLDGNCVFGQSFTCAYFLFTNVCHSLTLKGEKIHTLEPYSWEKNLGLIQGYIMSIQRFLWLNIFILYDL